MLIYLDIDGVMVPATSWKRPEILEDGFPRFSLRAVKAFEKITSFTNVDIVLTTSHKHIYTIPEWHSIFESRNISVNKITRLPENKNFLSRKEEIENWFNLNSVEDNFIIIDDDKSLNALPAFLKESLVQTSASVGLTEDLAEYAIELMKKSKHTLV